MCGLILVNCLSTIKKWKESCQRGALSILSDPLQSAQILQEQDKQVVGSNPTWENFLYGIKKP